MNAIRSSEKRINVESILHSSPIPVLQISGEGYLLYANQAAALLIEIHGIGLHEKIGGILYDTALRSLKENKRIEIEANFEVVIYDMTFVPDPQDRVVSVFGRDLTNEKAAIQNLKVASYSRKYVENIVNSMSDMLYVFNEHGLIESANLSACRILGINPSTIIGKPINLVVSTRSGEPLISSNLIGRVLSGEVIQEFETSIKDSEGTYRPFLFSISIMQDSSEQRKLILVGTNIALRKKLERELQSAITKAKAANRAKKPVSCKYEPRNSHSHERGNRHDQYFAYDRNKQRTKELSFSN